MSYVIRLTCKVCSRVFKTNSDDRHDTCDDCLKK